MGNMMSGTTSPRWLAQIMSNTGEHRILGTFGPKFAALTNFWPLVDQLASLGTVRMSGVAPQHRQQIGQLCQFRPRTGIYLLPASAQSVMGRRIGPTSRQLIADCCLPITPLASKSGVRACWRVLFTFRRPRGCARLQDIVICRLARRRR